MKFKAAISKAILSHFIDINRSAKFEIQSINKASNNYFLCKEIV